jgi:LacI family transcriptional regulator
MATIRDVAKACGVSVATVSGVLNNTPDAAGPETRARILKIIRQMNYSPNAVARGLSHRRMNTIGVVMDFSGWGSLITDQHLGPIVDGIIGRNSQIKQKTLLYTESWADALDNVTTYCDGLCDGLLLVVPIVSDEFFAAVLRRRTPFVIIGDYREEPDLAAVDLDNVDAGRQITSYLIGLGHKRIAMLRGDEAHRSSGLRARGYREALEGVGIEYDPALDVNGTYDRESGYASGAKLFDELPREKHPTALFCGDDRIALGALKALRDRGLHIPEDVSIIGINDSVDGAAADIPLSTLRQPGQEIGERAVDLLRAQITGEQGTARKQVLPGKLIIRSTTGLVPNEG